MCVKCSYNSMYRSVCCDVAQKGPTDQKIKLQKIKEKYLGFQGGDLTPICLLICCLAFLFYMRAGPRIFFIFSDSGRECDTRARTTHSQDALTLHGFQHRTGGHVFPLFWESLGKICHLQHCTQTDFTQLSCIAFDPLHYGIMCGLIKCITV